MLGLSVTFNEWLMGMPLQENMDDITSPEHDRIVSRDAVGLYVRQLATHANSAVLIHRVRLRVQ